MSEQAIEQVAVPVVEAAVKALEPEAKAVLADIQAHIVSGLHALEPELGAIIAQTDTDAQNVISRLVTMAKEVVRKTEAHIGMVPVDPSPAAPAPQA